MLSEFISTNEDWNSYVERLEQYFMANDVSTAGKKKAILLSSCGPAAYQLIKSLLVPSRPHEKSFAQIVETMRNHCHPKASPIVCRFTLNSHSQKEGESLSTYMAELRKLAKDCDYGESLLEMLSDRLVCGVKDRRIQKKLLAEHELTFKKAFETAQAMEAAEKNAEELPSATSPEQKVYLVRRGEWKNTQEFKECKHCGRMNHRE